MDDKKIISEKEYERRMNLMRERAAQCWCDERTKTIEMIPELAYVFAEKLYDQFYSSALGMATTGELIEEIKARNSDVELNYYPMEENPEF